MLKRLFHSEYFPLVLLIAVNLVIGAFTFRHYGESWDEHSYYIHAAQSLSAYLRLFTTPGQEVIYDPTHRFYGPAFAMLIVLAAKLFPGAILSDVAHAISFLSFQVGLVVFYLLARRWVNPFAAHAATLLFSTQPLLWGHAFINFKDTPFMVGFLACIYLGLKMADGYPIDSTPKPTAGVLNPLLAQDWAQIKRSTRLWLAVSTVFLLCLVGALTFGFFQLRQTLFPPNFYDPNTLELEQYLYSVLTRVEQVILFLLLFLSGLILVFQHFLPKTRQAILQTELRPIGSKIRVYLRLGPLVWAGLVLGFTAAMRFLALAAGAFVGLYVLWKRGRDSLLYLLTYLGVALLGMYVTWPYLWQAPLYRYLLTVKVMIHYPWPGEVLFGGAYYPPDGLPWYYLPKLIGLQLTEPVLLLAVLGLILLVWRRNRLAGGSDLLYLVGVWFLAPVAAAIFGHPYLYDNFRQLHFILPPLFLLAALALNTVESRIRASLLQVSLAVLLALPGLWGIVQMYPYEYIYYNHLATAPFRHYEADYWGTSFREASVYLNENVPVNGRVIVWGPVTTLWPYIRPDVQVFSSEDTQPVPGDTLLILSRNNQDLKNYPELPILAQVQKNGFVLAVIRKFER